MFLLLYIFLWNVMVFYVFFEILLVILFIVMYIITTLRILLRILLCVLFGLRLILLARFLLKMKLQKPFSLIFQSCQEPLTLVFHIHFVVKLLRRLPSLHFRTILDGSADSIQFPLFLSGHDLMELFPGPVTEKRMGPDFLQRRTLFRVPL